MRPAPSDMVAETTTGVVASGNTDTAKQADDTAQHASHAHRESSVNYAGGSSTDKYSMAVKHSGLYLDQILMERSNKKRRKKQHRLGV